MEVYEGVKFTTDCLGADFDLEEERIELLSELHRLSECKLLSANNGNVSVRVPTGHSLGGSLDMIITPSGLDMENISKDDMVLVIDIDEGRKVVHYKGREKPSSEAIMHWMIYGRFPEVNAIIHFHDEKLLKFQEELVTTKKYFPYGTVELAREVICTLHESDFIILRDHGALVAGPSLKACHEMITKVKEDLRISCNLGLD